MIATVERTQTTSCQFSRTDLTPGTILALSNAEHIRCEVKSVDGEKVTLTVMDNHVMDGKTEMGIPINELAERGWRVMIEPSQKRCRERLRIDPSEIRPGAILASPVERIRCRVDSVEHGRAKLSVLDNSSINGDKEVTVAVDSDLLTAWHLMKRAE